MKKILIATLALFLAIGGTQAQTLKRKPAMGSKPVKEQPSNNPSRVSMNSKEVFIIPQQENINLPEPTVGLDMPLGKVLSLRQSIRKFNTDELPVEFLSSLLWCAYGYNRPDQQMRVVPSATNAQEYDIFLLNEKGIYLYNATKNTLQMVQQGDHRKEVSKQTFFVDAPCVLLLVANYDRMTNFKTTEDRDFYAGIDCGYISQNIYLFCAANNMATVACGSVEREKLQKLLHISNGKVMLAHPIGMQ